MTRNRKFFAYPLYVTLGLLPALASANAACALAGTWQFFGMEGSSPSIRDVATQVGSSNNKASVQINSFPLTGKPYRNNTSNVIECTLTVASNGNFTGPCTSFGVVANSNGPGTVSGKFTLSSCNLTGTINVAGEPPAIAIQRGRINSNSTGGSGIATKGTGDVLYFTLVK